MRPKHWEKPGSGCTQQKNENEILWHESDREGHEFSPPACQKLPAVDSASGIKPGSSKTVSRGSAYRSARRAIPSTIAMPNTILNRAQPHPSTNPMNTRVAGFSTGFEIHQDTTLPTDARLCRMPTATGAAQQVHIMQGMANRPPSATLLKPRRPSTAFNHGSGRSTLMPEPRIRPKTSAFQIAMP